MELGAESIAEHGNIISIINNYKWKAVVLVGGDYHKLKHSYINFENATQAREWLQQQNFTNTQLLVKGSRSMQMEKVLE